jgi:elongation factor Ts
VRLACETDFVSRNEQFQGLLGQITGQVLAAGDADVLSQPVVNGEGTVENLITTAVGVIGENIQLVEAARISVTGQGMVSGYVHTNGKIGVLVALQTQGAPGDLAALEQLGRDVAMHIAASNVAAVSEAQIDPAVLEKEREVFIAQAQESGKSADIAEKMVQGRLKKFVKEISLLDQPFVKDPDKSVSAVLAEAGKAQGTAVAVEQFIKFQF